MSRDTSAIQDKQTREHYQTYCVQRMIVRDFYELLPEHQFDYRMVDTPERKSDTPRESLAHLLEVQLMYLQALRSGVLEFKAMAVEHYRTMTRYQLLAEMETIEQDLFDLVAGEIFEADAPIKTPWGNKIPAVELLVLLKDHDILHIGWNLALMDHLDMQRYPSLIESWG
jgi:hypothetical protein